MLKFVWVIGSSRGGCDRNYLSFTSATESAHVADYPCQQRRSVTQHHQGAHSHCPPAS